MLMLMATSRGRWGEDGVKRNDVGATDPEITTRYSDPITVAVGQPSLIHSPSRNAASQQGTWFQGLFLTSRHTETAPHIIHRQDPLFEDRFLGPEAITVRTS